MSTGDNQSPEDLLEEIATEWLLEREDGFTPERAAAFAQWRDANARHAAAVARVERTLGLLSELPAVREPLEARVGAMTAGPARVSRRLAWAGGIAAALFVAVSASWLARAPEAATQSYSVAKAEPRRISLEDGSVVDLNAESRLEVRFTKTERHVVLLAGEAHFQVAHNRERPFIVVASGVAVRAVGTAFDVRLGGGTVDVLVDEGKVEVARQAGSSKLSGKPTPVIPLLVAGQRAQIASVKEALPPKVEQMAEGQMHALLAWQNRMTSFTDVPLSEMVARMNRCNSVQLVIRDPQLGDRKVGGVIDLRQVSAFVQLLEQDREIVSERAPTGEIVLRRAR
jgi:transmembrane sensor